MCYLYNMRRLSIEVSPEQHQQIKALAALQGKSMKDFILNRLFSTDEESEQAAMTKLKELLLSRIKDAKNSEPINQSFMEIFEERTKDLNA